MSKVNTHAVVYLILKSSNTAVGRGVGAAPAELPRVSGRRWPHLGLHTVPPAQRHPRPQAQHRYGLRGWRSCAAVRAGCPQRIPQHRCGGRGGRLAADAVQRTEPQPLLAPRPLQCRAEERRVRRARALAALAHTSRSVWWRRRHCRVKAIVADSIPVYTRRQRRRWRGRRDICCGGWDGRADVLASRRAAKRRAWEAALVVLVARRTTRALLRLEGGVLDGPARGSPLCDARIASHVSLRRTGCAAGAAGDGRAQDQGLVPERRAPHFKHCRDALRAVAAAAQGRGPLPPLGGREGVDLGPEWAWRRVTGSRFVGRGSRRRAVCRAAWRWGPHRHALLRARSMAAGRAWAAGGRGRVLKANLMPGYEPPPQRTQPEDEHTNDEGDVAHRRGRQGSNSRAAGRLEQGTLGSDQLRVPTLISGRLRRRWA
ncbi:hypothetical protein T492DRAFT_1031009, partial [Pavlovales sp. CCMP2436]